TPLRHYARSLADVSALQHRPHGTRRSMDRPAQPSWHARSRKWNVRTLHMQNLISLNLSAQDTADLDAALDTLRRVFAPLIALKPEQRRELNKMGDKSEVFCRQTLSLLTANPQIVPPNLGVA